MNMVRNLERNDVAKLKEIHSRFFKDEFSFDDFCQASFHHFVITNENDEIISAGAIRPLAEIVAITDYEKSTRLRRSALYEMLQVSQFILQNSNFKQLHAFVQNEKWMNQLLTHGFKKCVGTPVYINLE